MMEEDYKKWLANDDPEKMTHGSQCTYLKEIKRIESAYSVNIDTEYSKDKCKKLLNLIATNDEHSKSTRNNKRSYVNEYIKLRKSFD